jgi:MFS family permease
MKRALVFLLLGPVLAALTLLLCIAAVTHGSTAGLDEFCAAMLFLITFFTSAITAPIDGYLARAVPIPLRSLVMAIIGAASAVGAVTMLASMILRHWVILPQWISVPFAIGGAVCMGLCSALAHDYRSSQGHCTETDGLPCRLI